MGVVPGGRGEQGLRAISMSLGPRLLHSDFAMANYIYAPVIEQVRTRQKERQENRRGIGCFGVSNYQVDRRSKQSPLSLLDT
jgi:hypothetical protein